MEVKQANPLAKSVMVMREEFDDWAVLYNPDTGDTAGINPVGVAIWKLLDGRHNPAEIAAEIQGLFEEVPENAQLDIAAFIRGLEVKGFLEPQAAAPG